MKNTNKNKKFRLSELNTVYPAPQVNVDLD